MIQSSIPIAIAKAEKVENEARATHISTGEKLSEIESSTFERISEFEHKTEKILQHNSDRIDRKTKFDIGASIGLFVAFMALAVSLYSLHFQTRSLVQDSINYVIKNHKSSDDISFYLQDHENKLHEVSLLLNEQQSIINELRKEMSMSKAEN